MEADIRWHEFDAHGLTLTERHRGVRMGPHVDWHPNAMSDGWRGEADGSFTPLRPGWDYEASKERYPGSWVEGPNRARRVPSCGRPVADAADLSRILTRLESVREEHERGLDGFRNPRAPVYRRWAELKRQHGRVFPERADPHLQGMWRAGAGLPRQAPGAAACTCWCCQAARHVYAEDDADDASDADN